MTSQGSTTEAKTARRLRWLRAPVAWSRRHKLAAAFVIFAVSMMILNAFAILHSRAMTHFTEGGPRTAKPEALSTGEKIKTLLTGVTIPRPETTLTPADVHLDYETTTLLDTDRATLEIWHVPSKDPAGVVILFHSYASSKSALIREAKVFHDLNYAAFLVDFPGSGGSSGNETTIGVREGDDVAFVAAHARQTYPGKRLILYGQSMGSTAILRAVAVGGLEPDAIVIECPFDRLVTTVGNRFNAMGMPAFPGAQLLVFWGGVQCGFNGFAHNPVEYAAQVRCPTLLLHGSVDPRVTVEQARSVFDNLQGPKRWELLESAGHQPYLDTHPQRWKAVIAEFLSEFMRMK